MKKMKIIKEINDHIVIVKKFIFIKEKTKRLCRLGRSKGSKS